MINKKGTKLILFSIIGIAILVLIIIVQKEQSINTTTPEVNVSNASQEENQFGLGYSIEVNNKNSNILNKENARLLMDSPNTKLDVSFDNRAKSGNFIMKVFYDYEEINFKVDQSKFNNSYTFELGKGKRINLPIYLSDKIKADHHSHKLTVSILASPEKHAKNIEAKTNFFGITTDYELFYNEAEREFENNKTYEKPIKLLNNAFTGLVISQDFNNFKEVPLPPYSTKVKKGERVKFSYRAGNYENVSDYLIMVLLDWNQVEMDNEKYKLLNIENTKVGYGTFEILAPKEAGLYEFTAYIVPEPFVNRTIENDDLIDQAYRFTLEVE
ncbi:hypothetical protein ACIQZI_19980 [Peribacillus sp. NPDC096379]|uniref:hypothetical protein n=1 Tax=Peribacillus sp. NPDC096379 TaxID=3364393 RepID=UPI0038106801